MSRWICFVAGLVIATASARGQASSGQLQRPATGQAARSAGPQTAPPAPYGALPSPRQLKWHEMEMYCLIHFGANTYLDHEWGYGDEDPALINPIKFNARQIVGAAKAGGFKGIIVVAKHHDGLCLWPTKTTTHNISQSPWKNGKGDIVKEYQEACAALGMKMGVYCSPWDRNNPAYGTPAYLAIYRAQLKELYSNYGPLFMSWHDGANGGDGYYGGAKEKRNIDRTVYYDWDSTWNITRQMQPGAVIFGDVGPDVRWVGNEEGHAGATCWATYSPVAPDPGRKPANGYSKDELGTEGTRNGAYWMPAECDVPLRPGWFYHASQDAQVKSPGELLNLYYQSVGRGADLDLGLSPNKEGLLSAGDVASLKAFGSILKKTFAVNLATGARLTASNIRGQNAARFGPALLLDADRYSYWATDDSVTTPEVVFDLGVPKSFNVIRLRENIKLGQRIDSFSIDILKGGAWAEVIRGTSIGPNKLIRLPTVQTAQKVRLRITGSPVCIALSDFGLFREPLLPAAPVINREKAVSGISEVGWKLVSADTGTAVFPQDIIMDMGTQQTIKGFTYLPRPDKKVDGLIDRYAFYTSVDGQDWQKVGQGEFSNIAANPIQQVVLFKAPVNARYFKFSALSVIEGKGVSVAELGILAK